jgi:hypothetical protein
MEDDKSKEEKTKGKNKGKTVFLTVVSVLFFSASLILLWQGLLKFSTMAIKTESMREIIVTALFSPDSGFGMLLLSFFFMLISIQFSIYALIAKKG